MGKPFEVKEFDSIICNADYKYDEKYKDEQVAKWIEMNPITLLKKPLLKK